MTIIEKVIEIELSEVGYKEHSDGWTKYGQWYADNIAHSQAFARADWCVMFQTWSMAIVGVSGESWPFVSPYGSACSYLAKWLEERGYRTGPDEMPLPGDPVLYSWTGNEDDPDHVGLIISVRGSSPDDAVLRVVEGNKGDAVGFREIAYRDPAVIKTFRLPDANREYFPDLSFMLAKGSYGNAVELLQAGLICRGYNIVGGVDGYFGPETEAALKRYQTDAEIIVDGKAGTETFSTMMRGF